MTASASMANLEARIARLEVAHVEGDRRPGTAVPHDGAFHDAFPSWEEFWAADPGRFDAPVPAPAVAGEWLRTLRRRDGHPRVNPTGRATAEA